MLALLSNAVEASLLMEVLPWRARWLHAARVAARQTTILPHCPAAVEAAPKSREYWVSGRLRTPQAAATAEREDRVVLGARTLASSSSRAAQWAAAASEDKTR